MLRPLAKKPSKGIMGTRKDAVLRCEGHLAWIRSRPCIVPGCAERRTRACHVRFGLPPEEPKGESLKPGDHWTYPACDEHHREEHDGVQSFQRKYGLNLADAAKQYASASPALKRMRAKEGA